MATQDDVDTLVAFGVFQDGGLEKLAGLVRAVQSLAGGNSTGPVMGRRGRPAGGAGPGRPAGGKRAAKGSFDPSKDELAKMKETMTAKEIGERHGVSQATVNLRLKAHGLTKPRGKKGKK